MRRHQSTLFPTAVVGVLLTTLMISLLLRPDDDFFFFAHCALSSIERVVVATPDCIPSIDGADVHLRRCVGGRDGAIQHVDPFVVFDVYNATDRGQFTGGFPAHPHRGFVEIRYLHSGVLTHEDNCGGLATIKGGNGQFFFTGAGIAHEEKTDATPVDDRFAGFQVWLNVKSEYKSLPPMYSPYRSVFAEGFQGDRRWKVLSGHFEGPFKGGGNSRPGPWTSLIPGVTENFQMIDITRVGYHEYLVVPTHYDATTIIYCYQGRVNIGQEEESMYTLFAGEMAVLSKGTSVALQQLQKQGDTSVILLSAPPVEEPVFIANGFVTASREALDIAMEEMKEGKTTHCANPEDEVRGTLKKTVNNK